MNSYTCKTCEFFDPSPGIRDIDKPQQGLCRVNPPVAHLVPHQGLQGPQIAVQGIFPPIQDDQWCGEHTEREDQTKEGAPQ